MLQSQFIPQFSEENLESLLGSISEGLPSSVIIPWLQDDLVPFVSKVLPQGLVRTLLHAYVQAIFSSQYLQIDWQYSHGQIELVTMFRQVAWLTPHMYNTRGYPIAML